MSDRWPFEDTPDTPVLTLRRIVESNLPILVVTHDVDDGLWQFLDHEDFEDEEAVSVELKELVLLDPTLEKIADLPAGWVAYRDGRFSDWQREENRWAEEADED